MSYNSSGNSDSIDMTKNAISSIGLTSIPAGNRLTGIDVNNYTYTKSALAYSEYSIINETITYPVFIRSYRVLEPILGDKSSWYSSGAITSYYNGGTVSGSNFYPGAINSSTEDIITLKSIKYYSGNRIRKLWRNRYTKCCYCFF